MSETECPIRYVMNEDGECVHYLFPFSTSTIIGTILIPIITGLTSLAGLGGGGPALVVFIAFFNYLPKDANIIVFISVFGATLGNCVNLMTKSHDGRQLVHYKYSLVALPIMFIGGFIGVSLNSLFPSLALCAIAVGQACNSLPKIMRRYLQSY